MAKQLTKKQIADEMKMIVAESVTDGYTFRSVEIAEQLVALGLVESNTSVVDGETGDIAVRPLPANTGEQEKPVETQATEKVNQPMSKFAIATVDVSQFAASARSAGSTYPFEQLEVGQSFFVPFDAEKHKNGTKKFLASTVSSANARYTEEIEGQTRENRKGNTVAATKQLREFVSRDIADGKDWGHPGVAGAAVFRTL